MTSTAKRLRKHRYTAPVLARFGTVRNLTGGSFTRARDGAIQRSRF
ncbi:hypothetical protein [Erythrobacter sp. NAP1]|nr:hypothetical protein [Erythrobacter sp. NAP1]